MKVTIITYNSFFRLLSLVAVLFCGFSIKAQMITTYAGNGIGGVTVPGPLSSTTKFQFIDALAIDPSGNLYVCTSENKVFKITPGGVLSLFAGTGAFPSSGDGGSATSAGIGRVTRIIFDPAGNAYLAPAGTHCIRKVNTSGIISTIAGTGVMGYGGDGGPATAAQLAYPSGLAFDAAGNLYISDGQTSGAQDGNRIRKIDMGTGIITTIAGTGVGGNTGNGGPATSANISTYAITIDPSDNLFIQNIAGSGIRKIDLGTGIITNYAGNGSSGYSGDGGPAAAAQFGDIMDIKSDGAGNLYITEWVANNVIRKISAAGIVTTVAGNGIAGYSGDGSSPLFAQLNHPHAVAISSTGNEIYIGDEMNYRIRKVDLSATPICPNSFSITKTHMANGQVVITPSISPAVGTADYVGTINGNPNLNPLSTVNINTSTSHTQNFPGNGVYNLALTYIDTISSMVCTRYLTDTISVTSSLVPRSFNRKFSLSPVFICNSGTATFTDSSGFFYSASNPSSVYTIVTNWGNGITSTNTVTATNQLNVISAPVSYMSPGNYTVQSILSGGGVPNDTVVTFVNVYPCGDLQGMLYNDINGNCVQDWGLGEYPIIQNVPLKASDGTNTYFTWSSGGSYVFANIPAGTYTIEVLVGSTGYVINCANSLPHLTTVVASSTTIENFALNCSGGFDIAATGISLYNGLFPGQSDMILPHVGILNGTCDFVIPGQVKMVLTPCIQYATGGTYTNAPDQIIPAATGDTLVWNVTDLNNIGNFGYWNYAVTVTTCTTAVVGDSACITMIVVPTNGDVDVSNNIFTRCFVIGVSYDPNFKEVSPEGTGAQGYIPAATSELTYTLHFQNTGTAQAFNVALLDTISTNLDLYSLQIIGSSHNVTPYLLPGRTVKFMFTNINLPDSTTNEELSHGYVAYKINLNTGLAPATEIKNTGYIYFDYNAPVVTNTTLNTIELSSGIHTKAAGSLSVWPNPATEKIVVKGLSASPCIILLTDLLGKEVKNIQANKGGAEIDVRDLENGIYFVNLLQNGNVITQKVIISK
jgi:uncharacterized repeat protein (TIGR01451 family)